MGKKCMIVYKRNQSHLAAQLKVATDDLSHWRQFVTPTVLMEDSDGLVVTEYKKATAKVEEIQRKMQEGTDKFAIDMNNEEKEKYDSVVESALEAFLPPQNVPKEVPKETVWIGSQTPLSMMTENKEDEENHSEDTSVTGNLSNNWIII